MISVEESLLHANDMLGRTKAFIMISLSSEGVVEYITANDGCGKLEMMGLNTYVIEYCQRAIERNVDDSDS